MSEYSIEFARSLLVAADGISLEAKSTADEQRAVLYLSLLSCEVTLKALLERSGHPVSHIRKQSHNLTELLNEVSRCEVSEGGKWRSASCIRAVVANVGFGNATVGHLLDAEGYGASKYPNNVRYGNLVRHFPATVICDAAKGVLYWAEKYSGTIRK